MYFVAADGKTAVRLADYGSLGLRGQQFTTWLPMKTDKLQLPKAAFTKANPTRTFFVDDLNLVEISNTGAFPDNR